MSTPPYARPSAGGGWAHPAVRDRRIFDLLLLALCGLIPLALALGISLDWSKPNLLLTLGLVVAVVGVVVLMLSTRLDVTVMILAVYLGMLAGPVKLGIGAHEETSVIQDVLVFSVAIGALMRLLVKRDRLQMPPLSAWVFAYIAVVLVEAFNPKTDGILHVLGGFRQQLEWVPFFWFGYALMRSKDRFRKMFLVLGVIALANAIVATYQTRLSPQQVAAWGPGYRARIFPTASGIKGGGRIYVSEGEAKVRPLALGSDSGFGGGVGLIALPGALALLAIVRRRRRWIAIALALAALVAIATSLGRLAFVGSGIAVVAFALLSSVAGRSLSRTSLVLLAMVVIAVPLGVLFVEIEGAGTFKRYEDIGASSTGYKEKAWTNIPKVIGEAPFGVGLGTVGSVAGFGGKVTELLPEGKGVTADTQWNLLVDETGAPGLIVWVALLLEMVLLAERRLRYFADGELRISLAAVFAPIAAFIPMGFSGALSTSAALGPYYWFAAGIAGYWFIGPGRKIGATLSPTEPALTAAPS